MTRAWLLPEHIADVLPAEAARIESLRRVLLDSAARYGYELVIPPLLEHLESVMSGSGGELELQTFKLVDQLSGRTLGLRADTTPQAARIDAHLLNREGVTRLCYCGPVLHTRPLGVAGQREQLQFGAEVFGHGGLEADLEVQALALDLLHEVGLRDCVIDLADARVLSAILETAAPDVHRHADIVAALRRKDGVQVLELAGGLPAEARRALQTLLDLFGGMEVIEAARKRLPDDPRIGRALDDLTWLASHLGAQRPEAQVRFDLSDVGGWGYYTGPRFSIFSPGAYDAIARGGRYDEVGAVFGRNRPAAGFSLDVKALSGLVPGDGSVSAIRADWSEDERQRAAVRRLREAGHTVVLDFPGARAQECHRAFDRELVEVGGLWVVHALP